MCSLAAQNKCPGLNSTRNCVAFSGMDCGRITLSTSIIFIFLFAFLLGIATDPGHKAARIRHIHRRRHKGNAGRVPGAASGRGESRWGYFPRAIIVPSHFMGCSAQEEAQGCRVMGGDGEFPRFQHPGTPWKQEYPRSAEGAPYPKRIGRGNPLARGKTPP